MSNWDLKHQEVQKGPRKMHKSLPAFIGLKTPPCIPDGNLKHQEAQKGPRKDLEGGKKVLVVPLGAERYGYTEVQKW